jgi:hypothetical protein
MLCPSGHRALHCIALQPLAKPCMTPRMRCARRYKETRSHTLMRVPARARAAVGRSVACRADGSEALSRGAAFGAVRNKGGLRDAFTIRNCWDGYAYEVAFQLHDPYIEVLRSATSSHCHSQHATYASDATHLPCSIRLECNMPPPLGAGHAVPFHALALPLSCCTHIRCVFVPRKSKSSCRASRGGPSCTTCGTGYGHARTALRHRPRPQRPQRWRYLRHAIAAAGPPSRRWSTNKTAKKS